jgi:tRNA(adenine34) deaminase
MCTGALYWSKIGGWSGERLMKKTGMRELPVVIFHFTPKTTIKKGVMDNECAELMKDIL